MKYIIEILDDSAPTFRVDDGPDHACKKYEIKWERETSGEFRNVVSINVEF